MGVGGAQTRKMALALAGSFEAPHFERTSFRASQGKSSRIFATMPADGQTINVFVDDQAREQALVLYADCVTKLYWGKRVCGVTIDLRLSTPSVVQKLLTAAHRHACR